jgi:hypothetical protein
MARDPSLFAEVICAAFHAQHREEHDQISDPDRVRAGVAYDCLSEWRIVPGADAGARADSFSAQALRRFSAQYRQWR